MNRILQYIKSKAFKVNTNNSTLDFPSEISVLNSYSMSGIHVLKKQFALAQDITQRNIEGDFVECGVCNGGSAATISLAFINSNKKAWLYDSFQGLPEPEEIDGVLAKDYVGAFLGLEEKVKEAMEIAHFPKERYLIQKGWFADTFQEPLPEMISFLHIDSDWYDSVMLCLDTFYDLVSTGGIILLDDFGHWEGCREAFYDFAQKRGIKPLLERFGHTQAFWVKGRLHNRDFRGQREIP